MLDWERIRDLREDIGPEDYAEIVSLFFEEADGAVARLRGPSSLGEREADLHFLKGCAVNLGFSRLGDLCDNGERHAAAGRIDEAEVLAVIVCYEASRAVFEDSAAAPA